jgi:hypothetical protein
MRDPAKSLSAFANGSCGIFTGAAMLLKQQVFMGLVRQVAVSAAEPSNSQSISSG